jgi:hypothetical protein
MLRSLRFYYIMIIFLGSSVGLFAQPAIQWDKTIGGTGNDGFSKILPMSGGGYILAGSSNSPAGHDKTNDGNGDLDFWIVKISANGTKEWDKSFGGPSYDGLSEIIQTADKGYILAGSSSSDAGGDKSENSRGGSDYWVIKLDSNFVKEWDKTIGGDGGDGLTAVRQTSDGGYLVAGSSNSNASGDKLKDRTDQYETSSDPWLVKLTADGKLDWQKMLPWGSLHCFEVTGDGGYIAGLDIGGFEQVYGQYKVIKYNAANEIEWSGEYGSENNFSEIKTLTLTADGGYILGGYSYTSDGGVPYEYFESADAFLVKINARGIQEWQQTFGSLDKENDTYYEDITSIVQNRDGSYLVGGNSVAPAGAFKTEQSRGGRDFWILKLQEDGNLLWEKTIGGNSNDYLTRILLTGEDGFLLCGSSGSALSGEKSQNSLGENDIWLVKMAADSTALPASVTNFAVTKDENSALLVWDVLPGDNNIARYEIQQTLNREVWSTIGTVNANPESHQYQFVHTSPAIGIEIQYRLKIWDKSNKISYSKARSFMIAADTPDIEWEKVFGNNISAAFNSMIKTADGGFLIGGRSSSPAGGDQTESGRGGNDYWIIKVSSDGSKEWDKTFGGTGDDNISSIIQTLDGGYLIGGSSESQVGGDKTEASKSTVQAGYLFADFWVVKVDSKGMKQWDKTIGGNKGDYLTFLNQQPDGSYILGGLSNSAVSGDKTENSSSSYYNDGWLVKLNSKGVKVWDKVVYPSANNFIIIPALDGGFILGGNAGGKYKLIKISTNAVTEWSRNIEDFGVPVTSLQQTPDEGFLLGGNTASFQDGDKVPGARGRSDIKIVKLSATGIKTWEKTLGSNESDVLGSISLTSDGGYLVAGSSNSLKQWDKTDECRGYSDYWVIRLAADGSKVWDKTLGGNAPDDLFITYETQDGGVMLGGTTLSETGGERKEPYKGYQSFWMVKLAGDEPPLPVILSSFKATKESSNAMLIWQTTSEIKSDRFELEHSENGKSWNSIAIIKTRKSEGQHTYQFTHVSPNAGYNYYRLRIVDQDGTYTFSNIEALKFDLELSTTIYPNPAFDKIYLNVKDWSKVARVEILDKRGNLVYKSEPDLTKVIDISRFEAGLYFIRIGLRSGKQAVHKIVIGQQD